MRIATAVVLLPAVVSAVWWGPVWLITALVGLVTALCLWEFFAIGSHQGLRSYRAWTLGSAFLVILSQWEAIHGQRFPLGGGAWLQAEAARLPMEMALLLGVLGLSVAVVFGKRSLKDVLPCLGNSLAALLLVALPLSFVIRLLGMDKGRLWLLFLLALVWTGDTAAYFVGRAIGRTPMASQISPKKTWEGAAGNLLGSLLVAGLFSQWLDVGVTHLVLVATLANVAGQIGDLVESAYKRGAGVKDSGSMLPGHGGMLDRVDALILAAPVMWAYLTIVKPH